MMEARLSPASTASRPWINRNFGLLWSGQSISFIGDFVFDTTLVLWVAAKLGAGQSWAPAAVSGVLLCIFVPTLIGGPVAGVFVDRWDKRRTMLVTDLLRASLIGILLLFSGAVALPYLSSGLSTGAQLGLIYGVVFFCTLCQQFFAPARMALIGDIVDESQQGRAGGMLQSSMALAAIVAPPLSGPLLFTFGVPWALGINALSFVASFSAILLIAAPPAARSVAEGEQGSVVRELAAGVRFFFRNRVLTTVLIALVITMFGAGAINSLDIFFALHNLHASPQLYGFLSAGFGAGMVAGSVLGSIFVDRVGPIRLFCAGLLAGGVGLLVYARMTSFLPAAIVLGCVAIPVAGLNVAMMPIILRTTPRDMVGRVNAVLMPMTSLASVGSIVLAGVLVSTWLANFHATIAGLSFGPVDTIFTATGILCLLAGVYATINLRGSAAALAPASSDDEREDVAQTAPAGAAAGAVLPDIAS